jgi:3-hydroxyisobutyrate dehydrogenase-like beta-hydroxyacid dehydrogenase
MRIGIIGLGEIGGNLAAWLAASGHEVHGFDPSAEAAQRATARGVHMAASRTALIERSEFVATSLPSLAAIETSYFAEDGLIAGHRPGLVTLECSTVPPDLARRITAERKAAGGVAVESPVVGIGPDARAGKLFFIVAGSDEDVESVRPFLEAAGRDWQRTGASGTAAIAKGLNNGVGYATICAVAEAVALAEHHGIAAETLVHIMRGGGGAGSSVVLDRHGAEMAKSASGARPYNPIPLKDAEALGKLLEGRAGDALPMLATMVATYRRDLADSDIGVPERLTRRARQRLEGAG